MKVTLGKNGLKKTWQNDFREDLQCVHCGGTAKIAFVAHEGLDEDDRRGRDTSKITYVCDLRKNNYPDDVWVHDCCAVAVYFCTSCLKVTATMNQG